MKKKLLFRFFLLFAILLSVEAYGQRREVRGKVTNDRGEPIAGVSITVKGARFGSQTDELGQFSVSVPDDGTILIFRYIGFTEREVSLRSNQISVETVVLKEDPSTITEVLVTGYGQELKKQSLTGAVAVLGGKEIESLPTQTFDRAMQGRLSGVQVTSNGGQPGGGLQVNIRGAISVNGSTQPLYIIDGVQMNPGGVSTVTTQNIFANINQQDIESIQVLKDGASASIYGAQAANGVVIVTTKKGKAGRTQIKLDVQQGFQQNPNPYDLLSGPDYVELYARAFYNQYDWVYGDGDAGVEAMYQSFFGTDNPTIADVNWYDEVFRTANVGQYNLSFSGGNDKTNFFTSGGYNSTEGTNIGSSFNRGNFRANFGYDASDKFSIETNISLSGTVSEGPTTSNGFYINTPFTAPLLTPSVNPVYNEDGTYNNDLINGYGYNIVQVLNEQIRRTSTYATISNLALNYEVIPGLKLRGFAGIDFSDANNYSFSPASIPSYEAQGGTGSENYYRTINWNTSFTASYNHVFNKDHNFSALAGFEYRDYSQTTLSAAAQGFPNSALTLISQASTNTGYGSTYTGNKMSSIFGSANYDYRGKYLLAANLRYDGSSRFGSNNQFGLFYGLSAGWVLNQEDFLRDISFLNLLKLRASYGVTGDQGNIGNFESLTLFSSPGASGAYNGAASLRPSQIGAPDIGWERVGSLNLGLDFGFFNNRIFGAFDIYQNNRTSLLLNRQIPSDSGYESIRLNSGEVRIQGLDVELGVVPIRTTSFNWRSSFNIAFVRNELLSLNDGLTELNSGQYVVGEPLNLVYTYLWAGVNPADGRAMYYDANGDITYTPTTDDRVNLGTYQPDFYGGWTNTFTYKGLELDVLFQYQYGNYAYTDTNYALELSGAYGYNALTSQLYDAWENPGDIASVPRPYWGGAEAGSSAISTYSSRWLQDASYIRLKQLTLAYNLPQSVSSKIGLQNVRIYGQGMNLWTITNYTGEDPENTSFTNNMNVYPHPVTVTFGANITF